MWGDKAKRFDPKHSVGTRSGPKRYPSEPEVPRGRWVDAGPEDLNDALDEIFMDSQLRVLSSLQGSVVRIQDKMRDAGIRIDRHDLNFEEHRK